MLEVKRVRESYYKFVKTALTDNDEREKSRMVSLTMNEVAETALCN